MANYWALTVVEFTWQNPAKASESDNHLIFYPIRSMTFEHGWLHDMDTGWAWKRGDLPGSGRSRARLLLPEPDQFQHPESGSVLPAGLPRMPHLQTISGDVANLRIIAKVPGVRILHLNSLKPKTWQLRHCCPVGATFSESRPGGGFYLKFLPDL